MEAVAHRVMKHSSWGYYFTGERDEFTKYGNIMVGSPHVPSRQLGPPWLPCHFPITLCASSSRLVM